MKEVKREVGGYNKNMVWIPDGSGPKPPRSFFL